MAWRRRARQSVVKHCITKHCNAKHGIARRRRTQHRTACHGMALGSLDGKWIAFERSGSVLSRGSMSSSLGSPKSSPQGGADGEHPLALLSTSPSQSRNGAPALYFFKATTPQRGGGAFCGPKNQRIDNGIVIASDVFSGGMFLDSGLICKGCKCPRCRNVANAAAGVSI